MLISSLYFSKTRQKIGKQKSKVWSSCIFHIASSKYFSSDPQLRSPDNLVSYKNDLCLVCSIVTNIFFSTIPNHILLRLPVEPGAKKRFAEDFFALKLRCCNEQLSTFSMVTVSPPAILRTLLQMTSISDKFLQKTEPVARDNNSC